MSACSAVPSGGDESVDWGASDEGDDGDDPELPLRGIKVFDHKTSNCLAGHTAAADRRGCKGALMRIQGPLWAPWDGQPVKQNRLHGNRILRVSLHQSDKEYNKTSRWHENEREDEDDGTDDQT